MIGTSPFSKDCKDLILARHHEWNLRIHRMMVVSPLARLLACHFLRMIGIGSGEVVGGVGLPSDIGDRCEEGRRYCAAWS